MSKHGFVAKWMNLVIAALVATPIALTAFGGGGIAQAADTVVAVDDAGADDEPGQKDLNALSVNYGEPGATEISVTWNWDDTASSGANTRDGCSLFDTDGDGFANFALCLTVDSTNLATPSLYECTADSRTDRCAGPTQLGAITSTLSATVGAGDPFGPGGSNVTASHSSGNTCRDNPACYTQDTIASALVKLADVGGGVAKLINVCSYPSQEPNSDPSDCVFQPNNGFLTIVKTVDDATTDQFVFNASAAGSNNVSQWTITGAGSVSTISYVPTTTLDLNEVIPAVWNLASASCLMQTQTPTNTGTATATGIDNFEIRSGLETICTFSNTKKQAGVTLRKVWVDGKPGDTAALTLSRPGAAVNATSTAPDAPVAGNSATVSVLAGQTVSLSEDLGAAGANYDTAVACAGNSNTVVPAAGNRSATLLISAADAQASITCTFTNTRKGVDLTVSKVWQNAKLGDAVSITTTGAANNVNFAASAGTANETDTAPTPYKVFAGETLTFAEAFTTGSAAAYNTALACTGAADSDPNNGLTIAPTDTAITCTYTNARRSVQVVVAKQLSPVDDAGRFDLSINGATKVTNGGNGATSAASPVTVFVGDPISVAEVASAGSPAVANYTSSLACDSGIAPSPNTGVGGSFTVPTAMASGTTITCTFSNARKQATFTLNKDWADANAGEVVNLAASATGPAPIGSPIATSSTAPIDSGASMTVYSGQTISFSEAFGVPANGANYSSSVSCVDAQGPVASGLTIDPGNRGGTLVVGSSPVDVTCTISNSLEQGGVIVQKVWVNGRAGDQAALSASIGAGTPVQDTSVAPSAPVINPGDETLDNVVAIPAFAGDTVNFSESLGAAAGLYTTAWSCTNQAATFGTGTSGSVTITPADAGENPVICTITNTRKTATLQLTKDWGSSPATSDEVRLDLATSGSLDTAASGVDGSPNETASAVVFVGETYPFSETFTSGDAADYNSSWTCDGALETGAPGISGAVEVTAADADGTVACEFLNERKSMTLKLQKAWVNGHAGDTAQLAIDGIDDGGATSTATSALGTVTDTTNVVTVTAYAGETLTLTEAVTPGANYNSSLACGAHVITYSAGARTGSIVIAPADEASTVTCTYTNTRKSATLTVEKTWIDPVGGPSVTLVASGGLSAGLSGTTSSTSPTNLVAPNAPTMTIFAGETINVSETFADATTAGMFDTTLSCATPSTVANVVSGAIVLGSDLVNTTCTFDNVRKSNTLTLRKAWINGAQDDNVVLSIDGTGPIDTATAIVPDGGDGLSADTASLTVYAGESVLLSEMFDADNVGTYTISNFVCDDGAPDTWSPGDNNLELTLTNGGHVADAITCTVTNIRTSSTLTLHKVWDDPASGPALVVLEAAGDDAYAADSDSTQSGSPVGQSITIDVLSGETVTVSEAFDLTADNLGPAHYNTTLGCTGSNQLVGVYSTSVTVTDDPTPITCTFTNTRRSTTLTLQKAWVKPVVDDAVTLRIVGTTNDTSGAVVAPATSETASITVYSGETVTIGESFAGGNTAIYDVDNISCSAGSVGWTGTETDADATVSVSASDVAAPITCTITNSAQRGTIVIVKNTAGGDGTFDFDGTWAGGGDLQLTTSGGTATTTYTDVLVPKQGGYSVVETDPTPAFDGTNVTCTDSDGGSGPSTSATKPLTGSIELDDEETVTCTFTNTKRATIVVVKDAQPDAAQNFGFTTTGLATAQFTLDDDGNAGDGTSNTFTSELIPAGGTYTVTEGSTFGWSLSPNSSCTTGGTIAGSTATIVPAPGATVTCTFVNTANPAGLTATKHVANQVGSWGPFTFVLSGGAFTGDVEQNVDSTDATASWTDLVEGQGYTLTEHGPMPGYELGTFTCQMSTGGAPVPLADADAQAAGFQFVGVAGGTYQCDITNTADSPTLIVQKTTVGGFGVFTFDVTPVGANSASPAVLTATTSEGNNPNATGVSTLTAGEGYTVTERPDEAWIAGALTCTVTHAAGGSNSYEFGTPTLAGDAIVCSITNTRKATIIVEKQTAPDGSEQAFDFEASWNGDFDDASDFELADGQQHTKTLLVPGQSYSVEELDTPGWALTGVTCRGQAAGNPAVVTPEPGETVLCVFSNAELGDVTVAKVAAPDSVERDGTTYTVTYQLTVTNASFVDESYDLADTPQFASGVTIQSMVVDGPGVTNVDLGADGGTIVDGGTIAARTGFDGNDPLVFTVVVTFMIAGDTSDRECAGADTGTFNTATVVFDGGSSSSSDCVSLPSPVITVEKAVKVTDPPQPTHVSGDRYQAVYTVTVQNAGEGPGVFNAVDAPAFGDGATVESTVPDQIGPIVLDAGEQFSYDVTVTFTVAASMTGPERECGEAPTAGQGAYNLVTVTFNGGQDTGEACVDIPEPDISVTKVATTAVATHISGNTYEAEYTVTVRNDGDGPGQYDLVDLPDFGDGATVIDVDPQFVNDVDIDAGETDVYTVTVTFTVDGSMTTEARECAEVPTPGKGAYNAVTVSFNDGGSDHDADCIDIPEPDVSRNKVIDPEQPLTRHLGGSWTIGYILTVGNAQGAGPASYDIDDELSFGPGVEINDVVVSEDIVSVIPNPDFDGVTDTSIASGVLINDGETHVYRVLLTLRINVVPGSNGDCGSEGGLDNSLVLTVRGIEGEPVSVCSGFAVLSLHKALSESRHGGNATIDDFTLSASTGDPSVSLLSGTSGVSVAVPAGTYALAEAAFPGYHFVGPGFVCSNQQTGFSVTLALGDNVDCTITNEDVPVDLELTKDDGGFVGTSGVQTPFTYTITVENLGPRELDDEAVTVVDDLPDAFEWVAPAPSGCAIAGQKLTCDVSPASLRPAGTTLTISATARLKAGANAGTFDNRAYVTTQDDALTNPPPCTDTGAVDTSNNVDCEATPVNPVADVAIVKNASQSQVGAGGGFNWVLDITNNGPSTAIDVVVGDIVPNQLTVTGVSSSQFNCTNSGNTVACTKASLAVGETGQVTIAVAVPSAAASGTVVNIGTVEATTPDPVLANNSDDASVILVAQAPPTTTLPPVVLPPTGANSTSPLIRGAFLLVLLGGFVTLLSRRRRHSSSTS